MHIYGNAVEIGGYVLLLLVPTVVLNVPIFVLCFVARRRLRQHLAAWAVACAFLATGVWLVWHGWASEIGWYPAIDLPALIALGWIGWFIGRWIGRNSTISIQP
jgi:hypothetical protein